MSYSGLLHQRREPLNTAHAMHTTLDARKRVKHYAYNPVDRIGKGFSSVVYRGLNENNSKPPLHTEEPVAIKAIDMKGVRDAISREMLDCEIEVLTTLKHPNILRCHDVVREPTHCYIVTELCAEGDLGAVLKAQRRLGESETTQILRDIVRGFVELAEHGYIHRDLKLANIFMSSGRAVIADFGFAKRNRGLPEKERYNVGSPLYMSPEALRNNLYSAKNDVWSIGIMAYELLHGETPWECRT